MLQGAIVKSSRRNSGENSYKGKGLDIVTWFLALIFSTSNAKKGSGFGYGGPNGSVCLEWVSRMKSSEEGLAVKPDLDLVPLLRNRLDSVLPNVRSTCIAIACQFGFDRVFHYMLFMFETFEQMFNFFNQHPTFKSIPSVNFDFNNLPKRQDFSKPLVDRTAPALIDFQAAMEKSEKAFDVSKLVNPKWLVGHRGGSPEVPVVGSSKPITSFFQPSSLALGEGGVGKRDKPYNQAGKSDEFGYRSEESNALDDIATGAQIPVEIHPGMELPAMEKAILSQINTTDLGLLAKDVKKCFPRSAQNGGAEDFVLKVAKTHPHSKDKLEWLASYMALLETDLLLPKQEEGMEEGMVDLTTLTDSEDEDIEKLLNFDPFKEKRAKEAAEDAKKTFLEVMGKGHMLTGFGAKGGGGSGSATASARTSAYRKANMQTVASRAAADPCFKAAVASQEPDSLNRKALQGNAFNIDDLAKAVTQARPRGTGTPADSSIMIFSEGGKGLDLPGLFHSDISGKIVVDMGNVGKIVGYYDGKVKARRGDEDVYRGCVAVLFYGTEEDVDRLLAGPGCTDVVALLHCNVVRAKRFPGMATVTNNTKRFVPFMGLRSISGPPLFQNESIFFNEKDTGDGRGEFSPAKYKCLEYVDWDISGKAPAPTTTQPGAPGNKKRAPATKAQRGAPGKKRAPAKGI